MLHIITVLWQYSVQSTRILAVVIRGRSLVHEGTHAMPAFLQCDLHPHCTEHYQVGEVTVMFQVYGQEANDIENPTSIQTCRYIGTAASRVRHLSVLHILYYLLHRPQQPRLGPQNTTEIEALPPF